MMPADAGVVAFVSIGAWYKQRGPLDIPIRKNLIVQVATWHVEDHITGFL